MSRLTRREAIQWAAVAAALPLAGRFAQSLASTSGVTPRVSERIPEKFHPIAFEAQVLGGLFEERMRTNLEGRLLKINQEALLSDFRNRGSKNDLISYDGE